MKPFPGVSQVLRLEKTASTQDVAKSLAREGAPAGTLVWAEAQTSGRGRLDRRWSSPLGGLYFSLILRPAWHPERLARLGIAAAEAARTGLNGLAGIDAFVKPPNDLLALEKGLPRKLCGILAEAAGDSRKVDWAVLGVGINVNAPPALKSATSLRRLTGKKWEPEAVLRAFLAEFDKWYNSDHAA